MAVDIFLKLEGIKGESNDRDHKDEIVIHSFSWGLGSTGTQAAGGGGGTGKVSFQDIHFTMPVSTASPLLMVSCAEGRHHKQGLLTVRKAGDKPLEFMVIKLNDVLVSSYQTDGSEDSDIPIDSVSLNFSKIEFTYTSQSGESTTGQAGK